MDRIWLASELQKYQTPYADESNAIGRFIDLLSFENCYERSLLSGHLTASAWVLTSDLKKVALLHHKKLERWLQPGGHADGEENLRKVAIKELAEETGLTDISPIGTSFFDLDIHTIPERKQVPEHEHFDVRFAFVANRPEQLRKNEESNAVAWVDLENLEAKTNYEGSMLRMKHKSGKH